MVAIGEHRAAAPPCTMAERGVDVPRRRDQKALHAAGERGLVLSLDEHVHMVALEADVDDPEPLSQRGGDRGVAHRLVQLAPSQAAHRRCDADHDVQRMIRLELQTRLVPFPRTRALGLSPGTTPLSAAPEQLLLDVPLALTLRLRRPHWCIDYHADPDCQVDWAQLLSLIIKIYTFRELSIESIYSKTVMLDQR
jgi:hypothetical protein